MWTYFAEFQPAARRGGALSVLATFWMVGNVVVAGLAWAIIPHQVRHTALQDGLSTALAASVMQLSWASWRLFTLACAVPSLLVTVTFVFMPESPKFLVCQVWCPLCTHTRYHSCTVAGAARGGAGAAADDLQQQHAGQQRALQGGQPRAGGLLHQPAAEPGPRGSCAESEAPP